MQTFAEKIRELRLQKGDPLRKVAAYLDIDQAILSKIETGKRQATRDNVQRLAEYYSVEKEGLLILWLADKVTYELKGEELASEALRVADEKVNYIAGSAISTEEIKLKAKECFSKQKKVIKAWLFGSVSRGDYDEKSDVDVLIQVSAGKSFSLFDLAEIQHQLEKLIARKTDVVMKNAISPEILKRITPELVLIYEKPKNN